MKIHFSPFLNLSIFLIIFYLLSDKNLLVYAVDKQFEACRVARSCGNLNISFPFYSPYLQQPYCGYPGFEVSCNNNITYLRFSDDFYIIRQIFYHNQSLIISNAVFSTPNPACLPRFGNLSLPGDFRLVGNQSQLFLFSNCHDSYSQRNFGKYIIGCDFENQSNSVLALPEDQRARLDERECGEDDVVVAPIWYGDRNESSEGTRGVLERGFMLNWTASGCDFCERTGGKCGFERESFHFKCFCPDRPHAARCDPLNGNKNRKLKLGLGLGLGLGIPLLSFCLWFIWRRFKQKHASSDSVSRNISDPRLNPDPEGGSAYFGVPLFSYKELEEATHHFDDEKELGDGGFGTVYHGKLKDGREVAVKRLYEHNYKRVEQFMNEIEILTRLQHKNLVSLYGCTSRQSRELLLVYEYIPNGTVADHLHGDRAKTTPLSWPIRMSIAIETANALVYLHASDIVHRDVKTNNILLDNNFCVKVADFGLSRLFPTDVTHVSTAPQGTPGYVDPEYHQCYQLTSKSDVYSFGVVLVELISSMPAVDITRHRHEINLSNLAISKIQKGAYHELIDPFLGFDSEIEVKRMTIAVGDLAFHCLQQDKEMRPSMDEVLEELKRIERGENDTKNQEPPPSPTTVTENWSSSTSSAPNISG